MQGALRRHAVLTPTLTPTPTPTLTPNPYPCQVEGEWADDQLADGVYRWADGAEYDGELDDALRPHGAL